MKIKKTLFSAFIFFVSAVFLLFTGCDNNDNGNDVDTFIVPDNFPTIQLAIDAASDGDEVIVKPGTYPERIDFKGKNITVRSEEPDDPDVVAETIIDGTGQGTVVTFSSGETEDAILWGFTITGGDAGSGNGGGILIDNASSPVIKNNKITGNNAQNGAGGHVTDNSSPVFEGNTFTNNSAGRRAAGIYVNRESSATIMENTFQNQEGGAIRIGDVAISNDQSSAVITGNTITNHTPDHGTGGIKVIYTSTAVISNNTITNNTGRGDHAGAAITIANESEAEITGNTITGNAGHQRGAVVIAHDSEAEITNNTITNNTAGEAGELYGTGGGISVTRSALAVISDNTISGNTAGNTNQGGGGIIVEFGAEAVIENNQITNNTAHRHGAGIYVWGAGTRADIIDNTIRSNRAEGNWQATGGGISLHVSAEATIYDNTISNNWADWYGGGVYVASDDIPVSGKNNIPWIRMNCPGGIEIHNTYSGNEHGDDEHGGSDVFFRETI